MRLCLKMQFSTSFWHNVIHWSSHIYKKSSFLSFYSLLLLVNNTVEVKGQNWRNLTWVSGMKNAIIQKLLTGYTAIYRHLLSQCSKNAVLGRLEMVKCNFFFWNQPIRNMFAEKFVKWVSFRLCCGSVLQCQVL